MARLTVSPPRKTSDAAIPSIVTLAFWRVRRTWRLLLLVGLGILAAVTLVCTVPLYSAVSMTAGLRGVLNATPQSSEITLQAIAGVLTPALAAQNHQSLDQAMQQQLGAYLKPGAEFFIQTTKLGFSAPASYLGDTVTLTGASMTEAAQHLQVLRGRLPRSLSPALEITITQSTAGYLKVGIGSVLSVNMFFFGPQNPLIAVVPMQIVGIIAPAAPGDPYWHGQTFEPVSKGPLAPPTDFYALMSNDAFLAVLQQIATAHKAPDGAPFEAGEEATLLWYYRLNVGQIGIAQLDDLVARLKTVQAQIESSAAGLSSDVVSNVTVTGPALESPGGASVLERFQSRISVVDIPVTILLVQVVGLILFFVGLMASLLVERQADVIALLRSRGASRRQVFGSFAIQSLGLALLALIVGPLLAILAARLLVQHTLAPADQQASNILAGNPVPVALGVGWFALAAALSAVLAMLFAVRGAASRDVLEMRREAARATRRPLWQRAYLDVFAIVIALTGFITSLYVTNLSALDAQTVLLIAVPLALVAPIFLVIAGILLFLRFFPLLLRLVARVASRRPGAAPMLALAQMARAPRQAIRMILLLALASSFASFALVFIASEAQHVQNAAAYQAGADFSGVTDTIDTAVPFTPAAQAAVYRQIPGVLSASMGYAGDASPVQSDQNLAFTVRAVDASAFAQTAIWTDQDSSQPLAALMHTLSARSSAAGDNGTTGVPAIVDALTWKNLNLSIGTPFILQVEEQTIVFVAVGRIEHIPTVNDSLVSGPASDFTPPGGVLVDYQTLAAAYKAVAPDTPLPLNYVWLRTSDDPALLAKARAALTTGPLALQTLNDRRAMMAALEKDPLYQALLDVLTLGTATTILLALVGNLIASWLSARARLINFAVLRALGSAPRQIARVLAWEQTMIYTAAIALGVVFGALLAATIVPALVFTGVPDYTSDISSGEFYALQHVLPTQVIVPLALVLVFVALVVICVVAIGMMARVASRPSISQTLRLNED